MKYASTTTGDGIEIRIHPDEGVQHRDGERWRKMTRRELLAYPKGGEVWAWLKEHGVRRPSPPSATRGITPTNEERRATGKARLLAWISPDQLATMDALAERWGCSRTEAVIRAVEAAMKRARQVLAPALVRRR